MRVGHNKPPPVCRLRRVSITASLSTDEMAFDRRYSLTTIYRLYRVNKVFLALMAGCLLLAVVALIQHTVDIISLQR